MRIKKVLAVAIAAALLLGGLYLLLHDDVQQKIADHKVQAYVVDNKVQKELDEVVKDIVEDEDTSSITISENAEKELKQQNNQMNLDYSNSIAWLYIPDTNINYPVMQSNDNQFYVHRAFDGSYLYAGSIFLDCRCNKDFSDKVNMVYGHNMQNGSMFADILKYTNKEYFKDHKYGWLTTDETVYLIDLFAVSRVQDTDSIYEMNQTKEQWLKRLKAVSLFDTELEISEEDTMLSFSTCTNENRNERIILTGKLIPVS